MEKVLSMDDWVVWITYVRKNGGERTAKFFAGRRNGQWKIIGIDVRQ